jgi:hypothetical protein
MIIRINQHWGEGSGDDESERTLLGADVRCRQERYRSLCGNINAVFIATCGLLLNYIPESQFKLLGANQIINHQRKQPSIPQREREYLA